MSLGPGSIVRATSFCKSSGVVFGTVIISVVSLVCECSSIGSGAAANTLDLASSTGTNNFYLGNEVWVRNLDNQLLRLGSRLDQLMIRMDHLDSRVGRVQSQGHLRFDSIETSMQTTRQRLDLWSNQLNLIEEQLTRKWKTMESRFESLVTALDSKLDLKFNLVQRDNRRHNEFISSSFNSVIISQEKMSEKLVKSLGEINSTLHHTTSSFSNSTRSMQLSQSVTQNNTIQLLENFAKNLTRCSSSQVYPRSNLVYEQSLSSLPHHHRTHHPNSNLQNASSLISSKVSNMFDELVRRSEDLETIVKDTFTMSNITRREVQDGFMTVIPMVNGRANNGVSSAEVMSAMIVESLTSVESMSTSLNRRMGELTRSVQERFEMVSMTLNGFLESCLRIQEKAPLIEEHIAFVLDRLLDLLDNRTRNATESWASVHQLLKNHHQHSIRHSNHRNTSCLEKSFENPLNNGTLEEHSVEKNLESWGYLNNRTENENDGGRNDEDEEETVATLDAIGELSEEEKKRFWESWLAPRSTVPEEEE